MPDPIESTFHVDSLLSDISIAYKNEEFIADQVLPVVPVNKQSDLYHIWTKGFWLRNSVEKRTPGTPYPEGRIELSNESYFCDIYHLSYPIADEDRDGQDPGVELEITGAEWLANQFLLNRELKIASDIFVINVWATDVVGTTNFVKWSDYDDSNPLTDITTGKQTIQVSTGKRANTLVMGQEVFDILAEHPLLLDKYKHTSAGILDKEEVRKALKIDKLIVGEGVYESTVEGDTTPTRAYIWGQNALLLHVPPSPGLRVAAAGYTFTWKLTGGGGYDVPISNERDGLKDRDLLKGKHAFDHKVTGSDLGYFFEDCMD